MNKNNNLLNIDKYNNNKIILINLNNKINMNKLIK